MTTIDTIIKTAGGLAEAYEPGTLRSDDDDRSDVAPVADVADAAGVAGVAGVADEGPRLFYGSVDEFVRERLIHMYKRKVGPHNDGRFRWAADWWNYPEALARLEAMWRAWEHLRLNGATGSSIWWIKHADHHMPVLLDPDGPFSKSTDRNKHGDPLPYTPPSEGLIPDIR